MAKKRTNPWGEVSDEFSSRLCNALKSPAFLVYFFIGVILIGGVGIWLPYFSSDDPNSVFMESQNVFTYSFAILGTLAIEVFLSSSGNRSLKSLGLLIGAIAFVSCGFGYYYVKHGNSTLMNVGAILTLFLFLLANVNDEKFDHDVTQAPASPVGFEKVSKNLINNKEQ
ncbi:hypothetical protein V5038_18650 [Enterobacter ludwigii]|jgi:hypothetical protein|uniref:hypothetical protein n=1 Tax=Enterobacter ludwigii TaxID=299767 RepID=UPI003172C5B5